MSVDLYPETLLNSVINSGRFFFIDSLGFSMYTIMSCTNRDSLLLSDLFPFFSLLFLSLSFFPFPCLSIDPSSLLSLNMMLSVVFMNAVYEIEIILSIPNWLRVFIINECWVLSVVFSVNCYGHVTFLL